MIWPGLTDSPAHERLSIRRLAAIAIVALILLGAAIGPDEALAAGGAIAGTVKGAPNRNPIAGAVAFAVKSSSGAPVGDATTGSDGHYRITGLPAGSYRVLFRAAKRVDQFYDAKPTLAAANPVQVTAGRTTSGIDAVLQLAGFIKGTITDGRTHAPIANAVATAYRAATGAIVRTAATGSAGHYRIGGLAAGRYKVRLTALDYVGRYYKDRPSLSTATVVTVTAGATTTGIGAALQPQRGAIAGRITDVQTDQGMTAAVSAYDAMTGEQAGTATSDAFGDYRIAGLPPGTYRVGFRKADYFDQYWHDQPSLDLADLVTVQPGTTAGGIDAVLEPAGYVEGTITDAQTHQPVTGDVSAVNPATGEWVAGAADSQGHYRLQLAPGTYKMLFTESHHLDQYYNGTSEYGSADLVPVEAGVTTDGIDAALRPAAFIAGTITDAPSNQPLADASAVVLDASTGVEVDIVNADSQGHYVVKVPPGTYKVELQQTNHVSQYFRNKSSLATATVVSATGGATTGGVDAALTRRGFVEGTLTDARTHQPLAGAAFVYNASTGAYLYGYNTDSSGYYFFPAAVGTYKVLFQAANHTDQYYYGKPSLADGNVVSVTYGATTSHVDGELQPGPHLASGAHDSSFEHELGSPAWSTGGGTQQQDVCDATAFDRGCFLDVSASAALDSFFQDLAISPTPGQCFTLSTWLRSRTAATFSGALAIWARNFQTDQATSTNFTVGRNWSHVSVTMRVPTPPSGRAAWSSLRGQLYMGTVNQLLDWDLAEWYGPFTC